MQRLAQLTNADGQRRLTHCRVRPDCLQQGVFGHQLPSVLHQDVQHGEGFGGQVHGLGAPPQAGVGEIELIVREVEGVCVDHCAAPRFPREGIETIEKSTRNL
jgi:hypothetical protein